MNGYLGKRFMFGVVVSICATVAAILLKVEPDKLFEFLKWLTGIYVAGQTITDFKKIK